MDHSKPPAQEDGAERMPDPMEEVTRFRGYDIIGDVHGCATTLAKLLHKLGYQLRDGSYCHPQRQAIFVGDVIDRGPRIREALHLVKNMVDKGAAQCLMGNHEYNALGYTTRAPAGSFQRYVREHTARHNRLIAETLEQFASFPEEWRMFLEWFQGLPLFLEMPGFRVVHACWDHQLIEEFKRRFHGNTIERDFIVESCQRGTFANVFMDRLTRGTDMALPDGATMLGKDGYERCVFRTKFWANEPRTYRDVVFQPDPLPEAVAERTLSEQERKQLLRYTSDEPPLFFGHYWLHGRPRPIRPNLACLDYSAVKYGRLVAYRFDGETSLRDDKFAWVYVDPDNH